MAICGAMCTLFAQTAHAAPVPRKALTCFNGVSVPPDNLNGVIVANKAVC